MNVHDEKTAVQRLPDPHVTGILLDRVSTMLTGKAPNITYNKNLSNVYSCRCIKFGNLIRTFTLYLFVVRMVLRHVLRSRAWFQNHFAPFGHVFFHFRTYLTHAAVSSSILDMQTVVRVVVGTLW